MTEQSLSALRELADYNGTNDAYYRALWVRGMVEIAKAEAAMQLAALGPCGHPMACWVEGYCTVCAMEQLVRVSPEHNVAAQEQVKALEAAARVTKAQHETLVKMNDGQADALRGLRARAAAMQKVVDAEVVFLQRHLESLIHVPTKDDRGHIVNGFAAVQIPDWAIKQRIEELQNADLAKHVWRSTN